MRDMRDVPRPTGRPRARARGALGESRPASYLREETPGYGAARGVL